MSRRRRTYVRSVSRWVLRQTGLIVAMSIAGALVGILTGQVVLGILAAAIVVLLWPAGRLEDSRDQNEGVEPPRGITPLDPFTWTMRVPAGLSLPEATRRLCSIGLRLVQQD